MLYVAHSGLIGFGRYRIHRVCTLCFIMSPTSGLVDLVGIPFLGRLGVLTISQAHQYQPGGLYYGNRWATPSVTHGIALQADKRACKATHIMIYVLPYRLSYPPDPRTSRPISVRLRRNRLVLGHKQLHDNPSEQIGYRAVAEDHEIAGFLALESEELGLRHLNMVQQAT